MAAATRPRPRAAAAARWQRAERAPRQERILCEQVLLSHEHVAGLQRGPSELLDTVRMLCKQVLSNEQVGRAGGSLGRPARCSVGEREEHAFVVM